MTDKPAGYPETPECDKMHAVHDQSQAIGEFLEWLEGPKRLVIAGYLNEDSNNLQPVHINTEKILAEFFNIDLNKADDEKRAVLQWMRDHQ